MAKKIKNETSPINPPKQEAPKGMPPSPLDDPDNMLMTEKEAAQFLKVSPRARQQRRYYSLPPVYLKLPGSSAVRYRLSVLMRYAADGEVPLP